MRVFAFVHVYNNQFSVFLIGFGGRGGGGGGRGGGGFGKPGT